MKEKGYVITSQRDGKSERVHKVLYIAKTLTEAKKEFKKDMTSDLYEKKNGEWQDECENEVWGFSDNGKTFSEDVFTFRLKTAKESKKWL